MDTNIAWGVSIHPDLHHTVGQRCTYVVILLDQHSPDITRNKFTRKDMPAISRADEHIDQTRGILNLSMCDVEA